MEVVMISASCHNKPFSPFAPFTKEETAAAAAEAEEEGNEEERKQTRSTCDLRDQPRFMQIWCNLWARHVVHTFNSIYQFWFNFQSRPGLPCMARDYYRRHPDVHLRHFAFHSTNLSLNQFSWSSRRLLIYWRSCIFLNPIFNYKLNFLSFFACLNFCIHTHTRARAQICT